MARTIVELAATPAGQLAQVDVPGSPLAHRTLEPGPGEAGNHLVPHDQDWAPVDQKIGCPSGEMGMTQNRGEAVLTDGKYTLSSRAQREIGLAITGALALPEKRRWKIAVDGRDPNIAQEFMIVLIMPAEPSTSTSVPSCH